MPPLKLLALIAACCALLGAGSPSAGHLLGLKRNSQSDLEITGMIAGVAPGASRYISYETLLSLPQVTVTVTGDDNFAEISQKKIIVTGVYLDVLAKYLGALAGSDLLSAACSDGYRSNYSHDYVVAHHPILALKIDGRPVKSWVAQTHSDDLGTYFITHATFKSSFKVLSLQETPQVPVDIVKLDFSSTLIVFGAIAPHGGYAPDSQIMEGYRIAQQHCYRCHNMGNYGGTKARVTWQQIGDYAVSPSTFEAFFLNPRSIDHKVAMPPHPAFDDATAKSLQAYFQTFAKGSRQ
jgi:hypothetical protein